MRMRLIWPAKVKTLTKAYSTTPTPESGYSPYLLFFGRTAGSSIDSLIREDNSVADYIKKMRHVMFEVTGEVKEKRAELEAAQEAKNKIANSVPFRKGIWYFCKIPLQLLQWIARFECNGLDLTKFETRDRLGVCR